MQFLRYAFVGFGFFSFGIGLALTLAVFHFIMAFVAVFVLAFIADALAPNFGGTKDMNQAVKLIAYTFTASWIGTVFVIIPWIGPLIAILVALYGFYILFLGLPKLMKNPPDKTIVYEIVLVVVAIIVMWVISAVGTAVTMGGMFGAGALSGGGLGGFSRHSQVTIDPNSGLGKLDQYAKSMAEAGKKIEEAQKSGDQGKANAATMAAVGAALGGKGVDPVQIDQLKPFVPDSFAGTAAQGHAYGARRRAGLHDGEGRRRLQRRRRQERHARGGRLGWRGGHAQPRGLGQPPVGEGRRDP